MADKENIHSIEKEALLGESFYLSTFLTDFPTEEARFAQLQSAGNYMSEKISREKGVQFTEKNIAPFVEAFNAIGILNPRLPLERHAIISLGLIYIGYELKNEANFSLIRSDLTTRLKNDQFSEFMDDLRQAPETRIQHRTQREAMIAQLISSGASLANTTGQTNPGFLHGAF